MWKLHLALMPCLWWLQMRGDDRRPNNRPHRSPKSGPTFQPDRYSFMDSRQYQMHSFAEIPFLPTQCMPSHQSPHPKVIPIQRENTLLMN
jgi:hypothetical protein